MATDYISRDSVCSNKHVFYHPKDGIARNNGYDPADWAIRISDVMDVPAADVRPLAHGEWTYIAHLPFGHDYECSVCKQRNYEKSNFCPNCGAVMRDNPVIVFHETEGEDGEI